VILTSSGAAIYGCDLPQGKHAFDETMWTDTQHPIGRDAYTKSKTLAEQAAWDYVKESAPEIVLTTVNPVLVLGAPLDGNFGSSVSVVERIMRGKDPMLPDLNFSIVDVRDVARMHVNAISNKATNGERLLAASGSLSFIDIAKFLKSEFPASKAKTMKAPAFVVRFLALFDPEVRAVLPMLGRPMNMSGDKARSTYSMDFIPVHDTLRDTAIFLVKQGLVAG
jgi:dihydroflavonol-4-reductase